MQYIGLKNVKLSISVVTLSLLLPMKREARCASLCVDSIPHIYLGVGTFTSLHHNDGTVHRFRNTGTLLVRVTTKIHAFKSLAIKRSRFESSRFQGLKYYSRQGSSDAHAWRWWRLIAVCGTGTQQSNLRRGQCVKAKPWRGGGDMSRTCSGCRMVAYSETYLRVMPAFWFHPYRNPQDDFLNV